MRAFQQGKPDGSFTPPYIPPQPPIDRGDWTEHVPGEGYARPAVKINFIGTVHHQKPDPKLPPAEQKKQADALVAKTDKNKAILERAIFILSQSATGRDVLEQMTAEGYRIVFDDRKTGDRGAGGLCDPSDKTLILKSHDSAEYLALLIGHEAVHAVQNTRHDLFPSTRHKPEVGIKMSFAIEADAYAQQTQIALELAYGDPLGPDDQVRMRGPLKQMRERFPDIVRAAERVLINDKSMHDGSTVAAAFEAFYGNFYLRTFYEDIHLDWAEDIAPQYVSRGMMSKPFSKTTDSQHIKDRIQHRGKSYLNDHLPNLSFDDARHSGVSDVTATRIEKFYDKFLPRTKPPKLKIHGVHMKDAVRWVMGLTNLSSVVFKKSPKPPKANKPPAP